MLAVQTPQQGRGQWQAKLCRDRRNEQLTKWSQKRGGPFCQGYPCSLCLTKLKGFPAFVFNQAKGVSCILCLTKLKGFPVYRV